MLSWIRSLAPGWAPREHPKALPCLPLSGRKAELGKALGKGFMVTWFCQVSLASDIIWNTHMGRVFILTHLSHLFQTKRTSRGSAVDLHYWIGKDSSQDEQGAVALYVTQLDNALRGNPVQHREVEGHESETFQSYFRNGIMWVA